MDRERWVEIYMLPLLSTLSGGGGGAALTSTSAVHSVFWCTSTGGLQSLTYSNSRPRKQMKIEKKNHTHTWFQMCL